ncbi:hypothetical protein EGW08_013304, partial [Elysia chlorotica]
MALSTVNRTLVAVDCDTVLPYICHHGRAFTAGVDPIAFGPFPDPVASLPSSMTTHQCVELCRGTVSGYAMVKEGNCYCDLSALTFAMEEPAFSQACPGNPLQMCGSNTSHTVYTLTEISIPHHQSCDELLNYGIAAPGIYVINNRQVTC